jgi:hypothetical protein
MKDYAKKHNLQEFKRTCVSCGKKFLGFKNSRYCFECSPYKTRNNAQKRKIVCQWCKVEFESNSSRPKWCAECSPYHNRILEKRKVVCQWCHVSFESNLSRVRWCAFCKDNKFDYLYKTISERISKIHQYNKQQRERELARFERLTSKFRFKKPHESLNQYYFNEVKPS